MKNEGEFEGKQPKMPFFVHKCAKWAIWRSDEFAAFILFYRLDRDALYMVGGWRDRTNLERKLNHYKLN